MHFDGPGSAFTPWVTSLVDAFSLFGLTTPGATKPVPLLVTRLGYPGTDP